MNSKLRDLVAEYAPRVPDWVAEMVRPPFPDDFKTVYFLQLVPSTPKADPQSTSSGHGQTEKAPASLRLSRSSAPKSTTNITRLELTPAFLPFPGVSLQPLQTPRANIPSSAPTPRLPHQFALL